MPLDLDKSPEQRRVEDVQRGLNAIQEQMAGDPYTLDDVIYCLGQHVRVFDDFHEEYVRLWAELNRRINAEQEVA